MGAATVKKGFLSRREFLRASGQAGLGAPAPVGRRALLPSHGNPGDWFLHCHKPMHMEGGMITLAKIA